MQGIAPPSVYQFPSPQSPLSAIPFIFTKTLEIMPLKNYFYSLILCLGLPFLFPSCTSPETFEQGDESLTQYVNPFIGTGGHGHTYPGATLPFGMVQLSPDTRLTGWDGCSGYHYTDSMVYGFSHTHLSGTGVADYGDVLLMPTTGDIRFNNGADGKAGYRSAFRKEEEIASPGYYRVLLDDYGIEAELTATSRAGFHQYHFRQDDVGQLIIDLTHRDKVLEAGFRLVNEKEIEGYRISQAWASRQHIYFVARFSEPIDEVLLDSFGKVEVRDEVFENAHLKAALSFSLPAERNLKVKVGISAVDMEGARRNLDEEIAGWDFKEVRKAAEDAWEQQLNKVRIEADEETKAIFYTAQYHNSLAPNLFQDVDGRYRGVDGNIHQSDEHEHYTVFSLWDTYRATHPWFTIFEQRRTRDFIRTMLAQYEQRAELPVWELAGNETYCMIGYHSVSAIADAYLKGISDFDASQALQAMVATAEKDNFSKPEYEALGYLSSETEPESVSKTLEYAYDDWCIARMAEELGEEEVAARFYARAQSYKNLYDPETGFMRPKRRSVWLEPFDPSEVNFHFTEANSWQYSFYVPQDVEGWIDIIGSRSKLEARLDALFSVSSQTTGRHQSDITGLIGQYAHGNEPSHHMAYLYAFTGTPWKGQNRIRQIMEEMYSNQPDGLSGNEDCGQMSAWYLFSALGFYPVTPGLDYYVIGSPAVRSAKLNLENGNVFEIDVQGEGPYIQSMKLNDAPYTKLYLPHDRIMAGGTLAFQMGESPNKDLGREANAIPGSRISSHLIVPVPGIRNAKTAFFDTDTLILDHPMDNLSLRYTLDGSIPSAENGESFDGPVVIDKSTELKAVAIHPELGSSKVITASFFKIPEKRKISLGTGYAPQYAAGGDKALIDFITGGDDYRTGEWQGYQKVDLQATVDMGEEKQLSEIGINFLQDENSWIFMPESVSFFISSDGNSFTEIDQLTHDISPKDKGSITRYFSVKRPVKTRFVRVVGKNRGMCPSWHKGAGGKAWIFADEIIIKE
jgi:predicted alpha-1,2-mannosidase